MLIVMRPEATQDQVAKVVEAIEDQGLKFHFLARDNE